MIFDRFKVSLGGNLGQFGTYLGSPWDPLELTEGQLEGPLEGPFGNKIKTSDLFDF